VGIEDAPGGCTAVKTVVTARQSGSVSHPIGGACNQVLAARSAALALLGEPTTAADVLSRSSPISLLQAQVRGGHEPNPGEVVNDPIVVR